MTQDGGSWTKRVSSMMDKTGFLHELILAWTLLGCTSDCVNHWFFDMRPNALGLRLGGSRIRTCGDLPPVISVILEPLPCALVGTLKLRRLCLNLCLEIVWLTVLAVYRLLVKHNRLCALLWALCPLSSLTVFSWSTTLLSYFLWCLANPPCIKWPKQVQYDRILLLSSLVGKFLSLSHSLCTAA